jgi:hypothetical protein
MQPSESRLWLASIFTRLFMRKRRDIGLYGPIDHCGFGSSSSLSPRRYALSISPWHETQNKRQVGARSTHGRRPRVTRGDRRLDDRTIASPSRCDDQARPIQRNASSKRSGSRGMLDRILQQSHRHGRRAKASRSAEAHSQTGRSCQASSCELAFEVLNGIAEHEQSSTRSIPPRTIRLIESQRIASPLFFLRWCGLYYLTL